MLPLELQVLQALHELKVRIIIKAFLIALMISVSVASLTNSYWKATWISAIALLAALFGTWRRYLEPLALALFVVTAAATCISPDLLARLPNLALNVAH
jgi:hypothetical protein